LRVLVVDDSKTVRSAVQRILHPRGISVLTAVDGIEALCVVERQPPDLIFMDLMMPRLDGYQCCRLIKRHERYKNMPVVMLSSKDGVFDRARGRMAGSEHFLRKPITQESLLAAIAAHVELSL
jgi:twitching motility two-component system response regulator PilG